MKNSLVAALAAGLLVSGVSSADDPPACALQANTLTLFAMDDASPEKVATAVTEIDRCGDERWLETPDGLRAVAYVHSLAARLPTRAAQRSSDFSKAWTAWLTHSKAVNPRFIDPSDIAFFFPTTNLIVGVIDTMAIEAYNRKAYPDAAALFEKQLVAIAFMGLFPGEWPATAQIDGLNQADLYAGLSYVNFGAIDLAEKHFAALAARRAGGPDFQFAYETLADYAAAEGDVRKLKSILALGRELYPTAEAFRESSWTIPQ